MVRWGGTRRSGKSAVEDMILGGVGVCVVGWWVGGLKGLVVAVARCVAGGGVEGHGVSLGKHACPSANWTGNIWSTSDPTESGNAGIPTHSFNQRWEDLDISRPEALNSDSHIVSMRSRNNGLGDLEQYQDRAPEY